MYIKRPQPQQTLNKQILRHNQSFPDHIQVSATGLETSSFHCPPIGTHLQRAGCEYIRKAALKESM